MLTADGAYGFVHPLVHAAVLAATDDGTCFALHAAAADALEAEGADAARVAAHVIAMPGTGDERAVMRLRRAAGEALRSGAARSAVTLRRRATVEPPLPAARIAVLRELGTAERMIGSASAIDHLRQALALSRNEEERAQLAHHVALAQHDLSRYADAAATLTTARRDAPENLDGTTRDLLRLDLLTTAMMVSSLDGQAVLADIARGIAPQHPDFFEALELVRLTWSLTTLAPAGPVLEQIAASLRRIKASPDRLDVHALLFFVLSSGERTDLAEQLIDATENDGPGWDRRTLAVVSGRACLELRRGNLDAAVAAGEAGMELDRDDSTGRLFVLANLSQALVERGDVDRAAALWSGLEIPPSRSEAHLATVHRAIGTLRVAQGDDHAAAEAFDIAVDIQRSFHNDSHPVWEGGGRGHAECWFRLGRLDEARTDVATTIDVATKMQLPGLLGIGLRIRGEMNQDLDDLLAATAALDRSPLRLDLAEAHHALGAYLHRAGARADAREPLRHALDLAHRCGARSLMDRTHTTLLAAGGRPRRPAQTGLDALTVSEQRIARLAAAGRTNREIAGELFVTAKTVEGHLANIFRKLEVRNRQAIAASIKTS